MPDITIDVFIERFGAGLEQMQTLPREEARMFYDRLCQSFAPPDPPALRTSDKRIAGVSVRWFTPEQHSEGRVVYIHGGGFELGSVASHHGVAAALAARLGREVISVDYRRMPEARYNEALDDCLQVIRTARPRALVGDSAGGRLALDAACLLPWQMALGLVYPLIDCPTLDQLGADAPLLARAEIAALSSSLPRAPLWDSETPFSSGIEVLTVEHDPLTRPTEAAVARWQRAGQCIGYRCVPGMVHAALHAHACLPPMRAGWHAFCRALDQRLSGAGGQ